MTYKRPKIVVRRTSIGDEVPPAEPLHAQGLMHPKGITTLYGESNVGKGWVACWVIRELVQGGYVPTILDYESVLWEWKSRLFGMGIRPHHRVEHLTVSEAMSERLVEPLLAEFADIGTTHLVIDSASAARARVGNTDAGGQDAAMGIFRTLKDFDIPCLLIAHRAKAQTAGPLGSVQYRNQSSMVLRAESESALATKVWVDDINDRPKPMAPFTFHRIPLEGGYADVIREQGKPLTLADRAETLNDAVMRIMRRLDRNLSIDEVYQELRRDAWVNAEGKSTDPVVVGATIRNLTKRGLLTKLQRGKYAVPVDQQEVED